MMWKRRIIMPSSCELSLSAKPKEALENERRKKNVAKKQEAARAEFNCFLATLKNLESSYFPYSSYAKACCHMKVPLWQIIFGVSWQTKPALYWLAVFVNNLHKSTEWKKVRNRTFHKIFPSSPDWRCTNNESDETGGGSNGVALRSVCWSIENYLKKFWMEKKAQIMICISALCWWCSFHE